MPTNTIDRLWTGIKARTFELRSILTPGHPDTKDIEWLVERVGAIADFEDIIVWLKERATPSERAHFHANGMFCLLLEDLVTLELMPNLTEQEHDEILKDPRFLELCSRCTDRPDTSEGFSALLVTLLNDLGVAEANLVPTIVP